MSPKRAPSAPPVIPGFTHVRHLGSGGFADVFLYEQQKPRRQVAVKVLLAEMLTPSVRRSFDDEADLMARLSNHPSIVTIYEAGVATDGRPYLAMEYCPRPNLGMRFRGEPFSVADALRIGVEIAGAVETAHRARILHRDIKPANVLVTQFDRPALTDFGISATLEGAAAQAEGMSIPWSPPESFAQPPASSVGTDVWALAATVYSLLAGRSPFEIPGGANSGADLIARIETAPLPRIGRREVPDSLERVLATAMAKSPASRYPTAWAFARALQQVQIEIGLPQTPPAVIDDVVVAEAPGEDDGEPGTRIRNIVSIDPDAAEAAPDTALRPLHSGGSAPVPEVAQKTSPGVAPSSDTVRRGATGATALPGGVDWGRAPGAPAVETTLHRPEAPAPLQQEEHTEAPTRARWWGWLVAVVLVGASAAAAFAVTRGDAPSSVSATTGQESREAAPVDVIGALVPPPEDLTGVMGEGEAVFTWVNPSPEDGDTFYYRVPDAFGEGTYSETADATVAVPASGDGRTCLQVLVRRASGKTSEPAGVCVP